MTKILFDVLPAKGHFHATLKMATLLKDANHNINYSLTYDFKNSIEKQGFDYSRQIPLPLPIKTKIDLNINSRKKSTLRNEWMKEFESEVIKIKPDIVLLDEQIAFKSIYYKILKIPVILFQTKPDTRSSLAYIFFLSISTGFLSLISIPVFGLLAWFYNQKVIVAQRNVMQSHSIMQNKYIDTIQGISEIKSANKEAYFSKIIKSVYSLLQKQIFKLGYLGNKIGLLTQLCFAIILTGIIAWTSVLVLNDELLLGQMMAVLTLISSLIGSVISIAMSNISFQEARSSL